MLVLASDIGTTSVRSMILDSEGNVYGKAQIYYPTIQPEPFYEQQDPNRIRNDVLSCMKNCINGSDCDAAGISAITFSSQMYSIMAVNGEGAAVTDSILWSDARSELQTKNLKDRVGETGLYHQTGCQLNSMFPLSKIAWIRDMNRDAFDSAVKFITIKEYITSLFLREYLIDFSMASSTGLFNIHTHKWHDEALNVINIKPEDLPVPISGLEVCEVKNKDLLRELGLSDNTRLVLAGGDGPLANIGSGASSAGDINIDLGTSGAARVLTDHAITDDDGSLWCFCLTDSLWAYGGILSNVGNAFDWLYKQVVSHQSVTGDTETAGGCKMLSRLAGEIPCGAEGVMFLPYLRKARSPYWDDRLRGSLIGLRAEHDLRHISRALIESIAYDMRTIIEIMEKSMETKPAVLLSGGISRGANIAELLSSVLNRPINIRNNAEASLEGAAIMAFYGMRVIDELRYTAVNNKDFVEVVPDNNDKEKYKQLYRRYQQLAMNMPEWLQILE